MFSGQKIALLLVGILIYTFAHAIPARRGIWRHITLADGTEVTAELRGDEHGRFWMDREGNAYMENEQGTLVKMTKEEALATLAQNRQQLESSKVGSPMKAPRRVNGIPTDKSIFQGKKKGIVILVDFPEGTYTEGTETKPYPAVKFSEETPALLGCTTTQELYQKIINQRNLKDDPMRGPFTGSVKDYFIDQSYGQFELDFDVVGPYTLSKCRHYYGKNNSRNSDTNPGQMVYEAVNLAIADGVDFTQYDWNGDNEVDQIFVLFAGQGEADGGSAECIWPHEYYLNYAYKMVRTTINGRTMIINQYACSNELATNKYFGKTEAEDIVYGTQISGIGTMCHEFSHCMGYPDMYDIAYENNGMGKWDLMDSGNYNGRWNGGHDDWMNIEGGYRPAGYTAFERWCAGWIEPIVLDDPQKITNMKPLGGTATGGCNDHGEAYVIYMPGSKESIEGEYYIIENRQWANWDGALPWHGLLVTYVHYDQKLWRNNCLNCTDAATLQERGASNNHQRITVFQAGGKDPGFLMLDTYPYKPEYVLERLGNDWGSTAMESIMNLNNSYNSKGLELSMDECDELSESTIPTAYYWGNNSSIQVLTDHEIWQIHEEGNDDDCMSFIYRKPTDKVLELNQDTEEPQTFEKGLYTSVTMNRQLTKGIYNTLWLPFDMSSEEVAYSFGEATEIYRLENINLNDEGKYVIDITEDTQHGIKAYEPIFIKIDENADEHTNIYINEYIQLNENMAECEPIIELENGWKMVGTKCLGYVPSGAKYLKDNMYYTAMENKTIIRAYRAYFMAPEDTENQYSSTKDVVYNVKRHDMEEDITAIQQTTVNAHQKDEIFDLQDRKLNTYESLPKGIYIKNGKKYVRM